jgi:tetratricopeptide (TPR) repeat protein
MEPIATTEKTSPSDRFRPFERIWPPVVIAFAGAAVYANSFGGPFIFDDKASIVDNPTIRHLWPIWPALRGPSRAGVGGRPLLNFSYAVNYALSGSGVWSYHALNLLIHVLSGLTLFGIARHTVRRMGGAERRATTLGFLIALLWTVHPLQTEAVTYISERAESMLGLFYLLTLYGFIRFAGRPSDRGVGWGWFSVICCLFGMATKEVMVTAPVVVFLYDRTFVSGAFQEAWRRRWKYYVCLAGPWILLGYLLKDVHERGVGLNMGALWWQYALAESRVLVRYLGLTFWPHPLILDYGQWLGPPTWAVAPYVAAILLLLAATAWALRGDARQGRTVPLLGFAGAWFFLILAPTSSVVALAGQPMAEHRMYLPLASIAAAVVMGLHGWIGRKSLPVLLALAGILGCLTWQRNNTYRSEEGVWSETVANCPGSDRAQDNLGSILNAKGQTQEAIQHLEEALRLNPDFADAHNNLAVALYRIPGRSNQAFTHYQEALRLDPDFVEAHNNLGIYLNDNGRTREAVVQFQEALRLKPDFADAHSNLGLALNSEGRTQEAIAQMEEALRLKPDFADAHNNLGLALNSEDKTQEAVAQIEEALRLRPSFAEAHNNLGCIFEKLPDRLGDAIAQFQEALRLKPDYPEAHNNLANVLRAAGRKQEAVAQYEEALRLKPDYAEAHGNLGETLEAMPGQSAEAVAQFREALRLRTDNPATHFKAGHAMNAAGLTQEAIAEYRQALQLKPDYAEAHNNLGNILEKLPGRLEEAIGHYREALRLNPDYVDAHFNMAHALETIPGRSDEAIDQYRQALRLNPDDAKAHNNLGIALKTKGRFGEAIAEYRQALRIYPGYAEAHNNLGIALKAEGLIPEAVAEYREALALSPNLAAVHVNLAIALLQAPGGTDEAAQHLRMALRLQPDNATARRLLAGLGISAQ